jgi:NAD(P)H-dependent flavin oxidoreductase YrpB (nitropropane dioxygenase family)
VTHSPLHTRMCDLLGVQYPIVQTGMGWVSTPPLVAATANAGAFGILGAASMSFDEMETAIKETRAATDKPFGVNMRADQPDLRERAELLIREGVRAASFAMAPNVDVVKRLREGSVLIIPTVGAKRHAEKVMAIGVDALVVQGSEGGGHTGPVHTTVLLPQVVDAVGDLPVIAAGGFFDGRGLIAALAYGASGIAMGTRFMLTKESPVPESVKRFYLSKSVTDAFVTTKVDGVPHRVLRTAFIDRLERAGEAGTLVRAIRSALAFKKGSGTSWRRMLREGLAMRKTHDLSWSQVIMAANTPVLLRAAMVDGRTDVGVMASGQVVGLIEDIPAVAELIQRIVGEAERAREGLSSP